MKFSKSLVLLFTLSLVATAIPAQSWWGDGVKGEGPVISKTIEVDPFSGIKVTNGADVYIKQGSTQSVSIEAQANIIDLLETEVRNGLWKIGFRKNIRKHSGIKLYITVPNLDEATVSGSGSINGENSFTTRGGFLTGVSGSGDIVLDISAEEIKSNISGSGSIRLKGKANALYVDISGSGNVKAYDMNVGDCKVRISGSGNCQVDVSENLEVKISGSGDVYYKGQPRIQSKISGSGNLESRS
ncbi:MAG: DUF2807 domain-containing protein [Saprospiraceae bacterium]|nr:MAG: DUF2807 domain-containing protein [Saprospiraceae bacterium]